MPPAGPPPRTLLRALTLIPAASIVLGNIIGTGVFVKARIMTCNVGTPTMVLTVWLVAGLLSLAGALVYAELAAMMPRAGGEYNFLGAAYGRPVAFMFGWSKSLALGASNAAVSIMAVIFLNDVLDGALPPRAVRYLPVALILLATALNLLSVRSSGSIAVALTIVKISLVAGIAAGSFLLADGSWAHYSLSGAGGACEGVPPESRRGILGFGAAMLGALWAYNGWNMVAPLGGEVKDPSRTLPRALIGGTLLIILLYMAANAAYFYVLTPEQVASVPTTSSVASEVASRFLGKSAAAIMAAGLMLSAYGTMHTGLLPGARYPYALAKDRLLPRWLATVSTRAVPAGSVIAVGIWSIILTLSGTFDTLTDIYVFILWIFYGLTGAAIFILRRTQPDAPRPYRTWGYPIVPILFLLATIFLLINTLMANTKLALAGLALIALGLPVYAYYARKIPPTNPTDWLGEDTPN